MMIFKPPYTDTIKKALICAVPAKKYIWDLPVETFLKKGSL